MHRTKAAEDFHECCATIKELCEFLSIFSCLQRNVSFGQLESLAGCMKLPNISNSSNPFKSSMHLINIERPNHFSRSLHGRHDGFQLCLVQCLRNETGTGKKAPQTGWSLKMTDIAFFSDSLHQ